MIPSYNHSNVLPPFVGKDATVIGGVSPYDTTLCEIIDRFATSPERIAIIQGLLDFRASLAPHGIISGYQWLSGSFMEDVETLRGRPPADIDVVTVARRPASITTDAEWQVFVTANSDIFDPQANKASFKCDTYHIDLGLAPEHIVRHVSYWYGLFSHCRDGLWKGMLRIPLSGDDASALMKLEGLAKPAKSDPANA